MKSYRYLCERIVLTVVAAGLFTVSAQAQWHYHYFKEKVDLPLDSGRVALLQLEAAEAGVARLPDLTQFGLDGDAHLLNAGTSAGLEKTLW